MSARTLLGTYALALAGRLIAVLLLLRAPIALDDMFQYDMLARSIAAGNGYRWYAPPDFERFVAAVEPWLHLDPADYDVPPEGVLTTFRPPLYPAFLAGVYWITGPESDNRIALARLVQAFVTATLAPLTALLAIRLGVSPRGAKRAAIIVAVYPILLLYPVALATENLFFPLSLLALLLALRAVQEGGLGKHVQAGTAFGAAMLTRSSFGVALPVIALWAWMRGRSMRGAAAMLAGAALTILPWIVRNSLVSGRPTPIETSLGYQLFLGYHPASDGGFTTEVAVIPLWILDDVERNDWSMRQVVEFVRARPTRVLELMPRKFAHFWGLEDRALIYAYTNGLFGYIPQPWLILGYVVVVAPLVLVTTLAAIGLALPPVGGLAQRTVVLGVAAVYTLLHLVVVAEDRYHLVLIPLAAVYVGHMLADAPWRAAGARGHWRSIAVAAVVLVALYATWAWQIGSRWELYQALFGPDGWRLGLGY